MTDSASTNPPAAPAHRTGPGRRRRRWLFGVVLALMLALFALVLLELTLRLLPLVLREPQRSVFEESARLALSNTRVYPGTTILLPALDQADVVVVGDSFPFGTYVRAKDAFPARLGAMTGLTVADLGVASSAPPQYNQMLEAGARYHPKHVIYCIFANDFDYPAQPRVWELSDHPPAAPVGDNGAPLYLERLSWRHRAGLLRKEVSNLFLSFQILKMKRQEAQKIEHVPCQYGNAFYLFATREYWEPQVGFDTARIRRGVEDNARLVEAADRFCRRLGASLQVVLLPSKEMVYGPLAPPEIGKKIYGEDQGRTYMELAARLGGAGIACLDLTDSLRKEAAAGKKLYFTIDGHFNELGHETVAGLLRPALSQPPPTAPAPASAPSPAGR